MSGAPNKPIGTLMNDAWAKVLNGSKPCNKKKRLIFSVARSETNTGTVRSEDKGRDNKSKGRGHSANELDPVAFI